jgi:hypothetical protein
MKLVINIYSLAFVFLLTGFFSATFAAPAELRTDSNLSESLIEPRINHGDVMVGGSVGLSYSTYSRLSLELTPALEYFIGDRLSIGGTAGIWLSESVRSYTLGPSATYYFWRADHTLGR